jgi:PAS domain S-box-containing protein
MATKPGVTESVTFDFLTGGGEMARTIAAKDWSQTPLGPIETWPESLRTTVSLCLASNFPISIVWGPERTQIYNDGYWPICGAKHPHAMGQDFRECWASAWPAIGNAFECAEKGKTCYLENQRMFLDRNGYLEETFFTFSFSPIRDENGVQGLFHPITENTASMLSERRTRALRDLAAAAQKAASVEASCAAAVEVLNGCALDVPFALLYLLDGDGEALELVGHAGIDAADAAKAARIRFSEAVVETLAEAMVSNRPQVVSDFAARLGVRADGPYPEAPSETIVLPLARSGLDWRAGVLVAGVSSRLPLNAAYRNFYDLLALQVATGIATARAFEEERQRAVELAEVDKAKTQFFSSVSHEFRTPLTLMLGPLEEMLARGSDIRTTSEEVDLVYRNALRLLRLVNSLLDFSRVEAGRAQAVFEPIDLAALTGDVASTFRSAMDKAGIQFVVDCPALPDLVYVDRSMWETVVLNLLSNALKFTFQGEIKVVLRMHSEKVVLMVTDTGTGIPASELPRMFERFYRVEGAHGRTFEGTGIGLSLVRELVTLHGGTVDVESEFGAGSSFTVSLPMGSGHLPSDRVSASRSIVGDAIVANRRSGFVAEALHWLDEKPEEKPVAAASTKRPRILVADDNADMRQYIERLLRADYDIESVSNGAEALEAARRNPPDLVLSDVMMPELDGFGLLDALRCDEHTRLVPVVLLSARAGEEARTQGIGAGADDYLVKPFAAKELLARVRTRIELAQIRRQLHEQEALRQNAEAIEQQWRLFDTALSHTPDHVYVFDASGRFIYANQAALSLWRKPKEDWVGKRLSELGFLPDTAATMERHVTEVVASAKPVQDEVVLTDADGEAHYFEYIFTPVFGDGGRVRAVAGTSRDVTERKKQEDRERKREEQTRDSARLESLGVMAGGIAHDFNNLLTGIFGNASLLVDKLSGRDGELAEQIVLGAQRAADLTRQMLAFAGKGNFEIQVFDLNTMIQENLALLRSSISRTVTLTPMLDFRPLFIQADRSQIQQIVMNFLINGSDAIGDRPGNITVRTCVMERGGEQWTLAPGRYAVLEVTDDGSGMTPEVKRKIFDPFFTTKFTGRGLGLAAVRGIVNKHKGEIEVESSPGVGTTFRVMLPEAAAPVVAKPATVSQARFRGSGETVLVVDDDAGVRAFAKAVLKMANFNVIEACDGAEALEVLRSDPSVQLVILDLTMPVMTGAQAVPLIQAIRPGIAIILSSGFIEDEVSERFASFQLAGFLQKPYNAKAILAKAQKALNV